MAGVAQGLRVLHVLNELKASGAEVMLANAARVWSEQGIQCEVLTLGEVAGGYAPTLEAAGVRVHRLTFSPSLAFLRSLSRFARLQRYDLVHVHPERAFFWTALAMRAGGTSTIVRSVHSVFTFTGLLRFERVAQRAVLRWLGVTFISVSPSVQNNEASRFRNHSIYMRNWVNTHLFVPPTPAQRCAARELLDVENALVLVTVGNCGLAKNHETVIQALADLDDKAIIYLHAGQEASGYPERALAVSKGVSDRCRFLSQVSDVRGLLHAADVFVMPSRYEGLGMAALEAAATGLPCVLAEVGGLADLKEVLGGGAIWTTPDAASVAAGIRAATEIERTQIAEALHDGVASEFSVEQRASEFAALYRSLLSKDRA